MKTLIDGYFCNRCGYKWVSRVAKPKKCPRCKNYYWDVEREMTKVLR